MRNLKQYIALFFTAVLVGTLFATPKAYRSSVSIPEASIASEVQEDTIAAKNLKRLKRNTSSLRFADTAEIGLPVESTAPITKLEPINADSLQAEASDSTRARLDSLRLAAKEKPSTPFRTSRFIKEKVDLDNPITFQAQDSVVLEGQNIAYLFGNGDVGYGDIKLQAMEIRMDIDKIEVYAIGRPDSTGELQGKPVFTDRSGQYDSKTMKYNFKSKKGLITDIITQQGEGYLTGGVTKKMENDEYYIENGRYTTCDNHEDPHFYMQITKGKVRPKKNIVTGPAYMVLGGVPLPIAVPFGYFPFSTEYQSGIIMPTFGEDYNYGFYLREGGYYFAINDHIDLALTGELYTRGSWGLSARSNYVKRYKFSGNFNVSYLVNISGEKGASDYAKQKNFRVSWTHTQDAKANPKMTFSASVNFATSGYTRNDIGSYYSQAFTENTKSSSINWSYKLSSKWNLSATATINQRTADSTLSVSFPNFTLTMAQVAPFKRKRAAGAEKWYEKITMSYNCQFQNSLTAHQDQFFKKSLIKDWRNGMKHSLPISATFNIFKYLNITPNIQLNDRMYTNKIRRQWDPRASAEVMDTVYGFYNAFDFSASISMDTKLYGFWTPAKWLGDKIQTVRHVLTPTISFSGSPDFSAPGWGYYGTYAYIGANGEMQRRKYSYFQNSLFGSPGQGSTGMLNLSLQNNLEMKVRSDKDSTGVKKISLIENFTVSQSYNFAADSLKWSNINTSILLRITKGFNLNLSATWDPYTYQLDSNGNPVRVNITRLQAHKGFAKLSSTGTSFSYTINNNTFKKKKNNDKTKDANSRARNGTDDENGRERNEGSESPNGYELNSDGYAKWEFPWSLSLNYSINYGYGSFNKEKMDYNGKFTQNLSISGSCQPTKNWNFNFSASYNFEQKKISYMTCSISRDLHCFTMTASFVPVGPYKSYNFHIAVKSSLLSDLKYDKLSSTSNGVSWY